MLKKTLKKTVGIICLLLPAVFFSTAAFSADSNLVDLETGLSELVYDLSRSVVTIEATEPVYPNNYSGIENEAVYNLISSGIVYDTLGRIITIANAVVGKSIIAVLFDDRTIPAKVIAVDYQSGLAVLQLYKPFGIPVKLSQHSGCAGQLLLAVGNSHGLRAAPSLGFCAGVRPDGLIQFNAQFSSSTHGGGLFSMSGELIGIISGGFNKSEQIGLSISTVNIIESVEYLLKHGDRKAGYLGLTTAEIEILPPIEITYQGQMSLASNKKYLIDCGVIVTEVIPNSPASRAGLKFGDILFEIDGRKIISAVELARYVQQTQPGSMLVINFLRHNSPYLAHVRAGEKKLLQNSYETKAIYPSQNDMVTDSILKEITNLKQILKLLENRLKQLR